MDVFPIETFPALKFPAAAWAETPEDAPCAGAIKPVAIETKAISLPLASAKAMTGIKSMMLPAMA